jgi:filamentous hemagglutinin family protein
MSKCACVSLVHRRLLVAAVAACFSGSLETVLAAPNGATIVSGTATVSQQGNLTTVTNSPGAIINWQAFSVGTNEVTRFIQQSAASSVLNRVVGVDPSIILGVLQSNGRVFLINPNGIVFGAGAQIDVAGLVASSLNLSNADFAAGRLRFTDTPGAGSVNNQGAITTPSGGQVYLIAPNVQNSGIITSPQGEIILAASRTVDLVDAGTPNLRIEITAPDTQAINIGQIIARSGKIGIYAALVKNSGEIRADGVVVGANGEILLRAKQNVMLENGSVISASGPTAGKITIQAESGTVTVAGRIEANATQGNGGTINISGQSITADSGVYLSSSGTQGGRVTFTATGTGTANATGAGQFVLNAPALPLATDNQISAGSVPGGAVPTVATPGNGNTVLLSGVGPVGGTSFVQASEGSVVLQGTIDVSGSEGRGGNVSIAARNDITLDAASRILANGHAGGEVRVEATSGTLLAAGLIEGRGSNGPGGLVHLLAPRVALLRKAIVDVSGAVGGGLTLIGGDFQGRNPLIQNASRTYFGADAIIRADAINSGDGGKVIVWSDDGTQAYGTISAHGGALSGNGGFVETSGKAWLDFAATVDASASRGAMGTLLLDPKFLDINDGGGVAYSSGVNNLFANNPTGTSTILASGAGSISAQTANVLLQANTDITFTSAVNITHAGTTLTAQAGRSIIVNANITTNNADITLIANETAANGVSAADRNAGAGGISMAAGRTVNAGSGNIFLKVSDGTGHGGAATASNVVFENLTAANVSIINDNLNNGSNILRGSAGSLITASSAVFMELEFAAGVTDSIGTAVAPIRIDTPVLEAHYHNARGGIFFDSPNARDLQIGGVPGSIFSGLARGVQALSGGPVSISVNGNLTYLAGAAGCGLTGGTGGPICANGVSGGITLAATNSIGAVGNSMAVDFGANTISATATGGGIYLNQMSGNLLTSKYTLSAAGAGQTISLATTNGTITVDSVAGFNANSANDNFSLKTAGTTKDIAFSGGVTLAAADLALVGTGNATFAAAAVTLNTPVTSSMPINLSGGVLNANGNLTVQNFNYSGGTFNIGAGATTTLTGASSWSSVNNINGPGTLAISGSGALAMTGGTRALSNVTLNNAGTMTSSLSGGTLQLSAAAVLNNSGLFQFLTNNDVIANGGGGGTFNNTGTIQSLASNVTLTSNGPLGFNNTGGTLIASGANSLFIDTTTAHGGALTITGNNVFLVNTSGGTTQSFADSTTVAGPLNLAGAAVSFGNATINGALNYTAGSGSINAGKTLTLGAASTETISGRTFGGAGTLANQGALTLSNSTISGSLDNQGTLNIGGGANTQINGAALTLTSGTVNLGAGATLTKSTGALNWNGGTLAGTGALATVGGATFALAGSGARILNGPTLSVTNLNLGGGSLAVQAGTLNAAGTTTIASGTLLDVTGGTFNAGGATVNVSGTFHAGGGAISAGTMNVNAGGLLYGGGTIVGNVVNNGTVSPGNSPGTLTINGNYTQGAGGTLAAELGGTTAGANYDVLNVTGTATLDGILALSLFGGYTGSAGDLYTLVNAGTVSGTFSSISVPAGYTFTPTYLPAQVDVNLNVVGATSNAGASLTAEIVRELEKTKFARTEAEGKKDESDPDPDDLICRD